MTMTTTHEPAPAGKTPGGSGLSPRQRQKVSRAVQYLVFVVVVAVAVSVADWGRIHEYLLDTRALKGMFPDLFTVALKNTVLYTAAAYVVGFILGLIIALMRLSSVAPYRWFGLIFIEIFRGLPALLILVLVAFGLPIAFPSFSNPPGGVYTQVAIGLGLVAAAYMAETIRAGIQAVPKGQMEAARSLGMSHTRAMVSIIIPQALRVVVPPLTNELVLLFKDSSLVFIIGVSATQIELTKMGESFATQKADSTPIVAAGLAYLIITIPLGYVVRRLEARQVRAR